MAGTPPRSSYVAGGPSRTREAGALPSLRGWCVGVTHPLGAASPTFLSRPHPGEDALSTPGGGASFFLPLCNDASTP